MQAIKIFAALKVDTNVSTMVPYLRQQIIPVSLGGTRRRCYQTSTALFHNTENRSEVSKDTFKQSVQEGLPFFASFKKLFGLRPKSMGCFVIGVSGVTCGGKTSLTKLIQRTFPWAHVIHQDHYFYDDDWAQHIRCPEAEGHVNYEIFESLDMNKMFKDVKKMVATPATLAPETKTGNTSQSYGSSSAGGGGVGDKAETPNYDDEFLKQIPNLEFDVSKYNKVPILILEGFTIFASQYLFDQCSVRFFCSLDRDTCRARRKLRTYFPPDSPSYFDKIVWPEYEKHFNEYIDKRAGVTVFDGSTPIEKIWKDAVQIVTCRMEEKIGDETLKHKSNDLVI